MGDARRSVGVTLVASRIWFALVAVNVLVGLGIDLTFAFTGKGYVPGTSVGTRIIRLFSYFTIQSNIVVLVTSSIMVYRPLIDGKVWRAVRLVSLLAITITGLVYTLVLAKDSTATGLSYFSTVLLHYVAPPAAVTGWLIFGPRPGFSWMDIPAAFIWPALWLIYTFVHGWISGWYPYPFMDVTTLGYATATRNSFVVVLVALVLAVIFKTVDRYLPAALIAPAGSSWNEADRSGPGESGNRESLSHSTRN